MNKAELREAIANKSGLTAKDAEAALDATLETVVSTVAGGDKVTIAGFGTFEPRERSARTGRNPQTGESIEIAASTAPAFKPAAGFKSAVSGS